MECRKTLANLLFVVFAAVGCSGASDIEPDPDANTVDAGADVGGADVVGVDVPRDTNQTSIEVAEPEPPGSAGQLPVLFFLFTHTEDPFNHALSEERYTRLVPVVGEIAAENPDAQLTWTVMFQGSDARTVAERNDQTGVADQLRQAQAEGLIEFGYHAHHDPTYSNRPQASFGANTSWQDMVEGMSDWVSCRKDLLRGGCVEDNAGGVVAIEELMGAVHTASGLFTQGYFEGGAGVHAYRRYSPDRMLGFGFPDHGPITQSDDWSGALPELLEVLAPAWDTSASLIWVDDILRINGGNALEGTSGINLLESRDQAATKLAGLNRGQIQFFNAGIASKYHYTQSGTSPTIYGYAHPDAPELPDDLLLSRQRIERSYAVTEDTLSYLAGDFVSANPGSRFVDSAWLEEHVAPAAYFEVSSDQIDRIAQWLVSHWTDGPPPYVYDGLEYYSLRDALVLLSNAVTEPERATYTLRAAYGPLSDPGWREAALVHPEDLVEIAHIIHRQIEDGHSSEWQVTPAHVVEPSYSPGGGAGHSLSQVLYGLAQLRLSSALGQELTEVPVPATEGLPRTIDALHELACPTCFDTAWSLKPARIRLD